LHGNPADRPDAARPDAARPDAARARRRKLDRFPRPGVDQRARRKAVRAIHRVHQQGRCRPLPRRRPGGIGPIPQGGRMTPRYDQISEELGELPNWVVYRREKRLNKRGEVHETKVPYSATSGRHAKSNDPGTWSPFGVAESALKRGGYDGV